MVNPARLTRLLPRIRRSPSSITTSFLPCRFPAAVPATSRNFHPCGSDSRHAGFRREHEHQPQQQQQQQQQQQLQPLRDDLITSEPTRGETSTDRFVADPPVDTFSSLNVYGDILPPGSAIETIYDDGFIFSSGVRFFDGSGALMVQGEVFRWQPVERGGVEEEQALRTGVLELGEEVWGALDVVAPKPGRYSLTHSFPMCYGGLHDGC